MERGGDFGGVLKLWKSRQARMGAEMQDTQAAMGDYTKSAQQSGAAFTAAASTGFPLPYNILFEADETLIQTRDKWRTQRNSRLPGASLHTRYILHVKFLL